MSVLSDKDIRKAIADGRIGITDYDSELVNPASVDLRLGPQFRVFKHTELTHVEIGKTNVAEFTELVELKEGETFVLHPREFVLGITLESVKVPADMLGRLDGKSSLGRLGMVIHSTAGTVNPGWEGKLTLEISNISNIPIVLEPGMRVAQVSFQNLTSPAEKPYSKQKDAKYFKQTGPDASKTEYIK